MKAKNGRLTERCTCAECGIRKTRLVKSLTAKTSTTSKPKKASKPKGKKERPKKNTVPLPLN